MKMESTLHMWEASALKKQKKQNKKNSPKEKYNK